MGESKRKREMALATEAAMAVDTLGGRMHVRWDEGASYAHITALRGDAVAAQALGMRRKGQRGTPEPTSPWAKRATAIGAGRYAGA